MACTIVFEKLTRNSIPWKCARIVALAGIVHDDRPLVIPLLTVCGNVKLHQTGHLFDWRSSDTIHRKRN
jgi:hypothetical protein